MIDLGENVVEITRDRYERDAAASVGAGGHEFAQPAIVGLGTGENFLGSDVAAFVEHTKRAISVGQDEIVILRSDAIEIRGFDGH